MAPLDPADKGQPKYVLAQTLRELLTMTGAKNCAEYARRYYVDPATVSKALGGKEIPTREFIHTLAKNAALASEEPHLLPEYLKTLENLYDKAIVDSPKRIHITQRLTDEIAKRDAAVAALSAELRAVHIQLENLASSACAMKTGKVTPINNASEPGFVQQGIEIKQMTDSAQKYFDELSETLEWQRRRLAEAEGLAASYEALYGEKLLYSGADDETELLNLDGLRPASTTGEVIPLEVANAMRSELEEKITDLQRELKAANDEVEYLRGRSLWYPQRVEPSRRRRQGDKLESLFPEDDLLMPRTEQRRDSLG